MGNIVFFSNWELWQQMTFVLACSIVLTFFAGLGKLWWINRSTRKHEILDEEKKSRMAEIQKTGVTLRKRPDIPFGVRAIQSGIEVDGIWISRPGTPNSQSPLGASSLTLNSDHDSKGKAKAISEPVTASPERTPSESTFGPDANSSPPRSPAVGAAATYKPKHVPARPSAWARESYTAATLDQLQGSPADRPAVKTYVPTNSFSRVPAPVRRATEGDRTSSSSDEGSVPSHQSSVRTHSRKQSPFPDLMRERDGYFGPAAGTSENPFSTPEGSRTRQASDASSVTPSGAQTPVMSPPARSYSGETHVNRSSRRVNAGFEVLPAGTFGASVDLERGEGPRSHPRSVFNKLSKSERHRSRSQS
ncbi:hypothetical protein JX266_013301 [Neoarthrinium moseri]|nr:hypothetical protein JX266_013301 [Neoarthrinium moseri]